MFWKKRTYLDYAAGPACAGGPGGNSSSVHEEGREAKKRLEDARREIARLTEVKADDVVFTSGATEANALAILGLAGRISQNPKPNTSHLHIPYLPGAHASIVENAKLAAERYGAEIEALPITRGQVDIAELKKMLRPETVLVTMEAVCGETGTIWNTREVADVLKRSQHATSERSAGISQTRSARAARPIQLLARDMPAPLLHIDASQALFTEKISRSHFSADLLTLDGAKLGAPGAGCLIAHRTIELAPLYGGGGQERGLRSGTPNVAAIERFARELGRAVASREAFRARAAGLKAGLVAALRGNVPRSNLGVNEGRETVPNILNISLPGRDTDYLAALLDDEGFAVSTKSACESLSGEGSRAVLALTNDPARAASTLRISIGPATTARDLARFASSLGSATRFIDTGASR